MSFIWKTIPMYSGEKLCTIEKEYYEMISQSSDTALQAEKVQLELIRESSVSRRVSTVRSLSQTAMYLSRRAIERTKPSLSEREVDLVFVANHYGERLAEHLRLYIGREQL